MRSNTVRREASSILPAISAYTIAPIVPSKTIGSSASPNDAPACGSDTNSPISRNPPIAVTTPSVIAR